MPQSVIDYCEHILRRSATLTRTSPLTVLKEGRSRVVPNPSAQRVDLGGESLVAERGDLAFKRLMDAAKSALREKGERSLHLVCGRLRMPWPQDPSKETLAPVYLLKVELQSSNLGFKLKRVEDAGTWELNPSLSLLLEAGGLKPRQPLPEHVPAGDGMAGVQEQLRWLGAQCGNRATISADCVVANISSADIRITRLLRDDAVRQSLAGNEVVQAKLAGKQLRAPPVTSGDSGIEDLGIVLPCDDSQLRVIQLSDRRTSLQVEGPPGTGKSQTIANIIANLILKNRRVLFVCEKSVAVTQVRERLTSIGLGEALLYLHDEDTDRRTFVRAAAELAPKAPLPSEASLGNLRTLREKLNTLWRKACEVLHPVGAGASVTQHDGLAALIRLRRKLADDLITLEIPGHRAISFQRMQELRSVVEEWTMLADELEDGHSPWNHVRGELFSTDPASELHVRTESKRLVTLLATLGDLHEHLVRLGLRGTISSVDDIRRAARIAHLLLTQPVRAHELLACEAVDLGTIERLHALWSELQQLIGLGHPVDLATVDGHDFRLASASFVNCCWRTPASNWHGLWGS